ncbi:MAG TPA: CHRD domain-containing protein [Gemmatimonadaceae bacterium]|jgi:CHRD domain-containing protein
MRRYYGLAVAALVLGCTDDAAKTTAPRLSGAVVGGTMAGHDGSGSVNNDDNGGRRLTVTLLQGAEEVPPRVTPASGQISLRLLDDDHIGYTLDVADITNITMAHIHMAPKGVNGGIVVWLYPSVKGTAPLPGGSGPVGRILVSGTFSSADFRGALAGKTMADFLAAVEAGQTYGNVHTDDGIAPPNTGAGDFPGGEIRGQLDANGNISK